MPRRVSLEAVGENGYIIMTAPAIEIKFIRRETRI